MNLFLIVALALAANPIQAQIFKCEDIQGEITYQDAPCENSNIQKEIIVQKIDPEITRQAVERLNKDLQQREITQGLKVLNDEKLQEREEREALLEAARQHTYALEKNTEAHQQKIQQQHNYNYSGYQTEYRRPFRPYPQHRKDTVTNIENINPPINPHQGSKFIPKQHTIKDKHSKHLP